MKIIKKITNRRAKALLEYSSIQEKFNEIKSNKKTIKEGVERSSSLEKLNFFIVLEYVNIAENINYSKIFPNGDYEINVEALLSEQSKVIQQINNRSLNYPEVFYKLGFTNEVVGCFLIGTRKQNLENVSTKNTKNTISVKIKNNFPKEIKQMCNDYHLTRADILQKQHKEFARFNKLSFEEDDIVLQTIMENSGNNSFLFYYPEKSTSNNSNKMSAVIKLEEVLDQNIEKITSVDFLKSILNKAVIEEKYEFCARVRDRLASLIK